MAWMWLLLAGMCEMVWPLGFKFTHGFTTRYWAVAITFAIMILSFYLMSLATRGGIPVGTTYAVWTGIGAAGTALLGILLFGEPRDAMRLACLSLIICGAVGLKFLSPPEQTAATQTTAPAAPETQG
jgi:quaternary ammonium compound-resistance protein SugE